MDGQNFLLAVTIYVLYIDLTGSPAKIAAAGTSCSTILSGVDAPQGCAGGTIQSENRTGREDDLLLAVPIDVSHSRGGRGCLLDIVLVIFTAVSILPGQLECLSRRQT